ncbi:MAG: class I SAM-dependent methyltransferase [Nannocystaceae bacterium]
MIGSQIEALRLGLAAARSDGLVLEFGVRFGTSIRMIAELAGQDTHGFDSFEGLPEAWGEADQGEYSTGGRVPEVPDNVTLHPGWFDATLPVFLRDHPGPVWFVNVDCDIYSSTKTVLELLGPQIGPGTVLIFDEYIGNLTWREDEWKALQEAVRQFGWRYEYLAFSLFTKQTVVRIST